MIHSTSSSTRPTATRGILSRLFPALLLASLPLTTQAQLNTYGSLLIAPDDIDSIQAQEGAHFGGSLAAHDFDGDGRDDHRSILSQDSPQITDVSEVGDGFATALAVGDFDHDGCDDLAIGVPQEGVGADMNAEALPDHLERKVERARPLIQERLQALPECHGLFADLGQDATTVLSGLRLVPASVPQESRFCRRRLSAFTMIGSPVIYFCRSFARLPDRQAAVVLIHEALHSAGLSERPLDPEAMDSSAINQMVSDSCRL